MLQLIADDCQHEDLSHDESANSKEAVARFYADVVASMPEKVRVVVDDITTGDDSKAGVMWHMEVDGTPVPCSRGLSFYRVAPPQLPQHLGAHGPAPAAAGSAPHRPRGRITYVRQSPEHLVKLSGLVLSASASATPIIDSLGPMALPDFWANLARGATNVLATAPPVGDVLMSLAAAGASSGPAAAAGAGSVFSTMPIRPPQGGSPANAGAIGTAYGHAFVDAAGSRAGTAAPSPISASRDAAFAAAASAVASAASPVATAVHHAVHQAVHQAPPPRPPPVVHAAAVYVDAAWRESVPLPAASRTAPSPPCLDKVADVKGVVAERPASPAAATCGAPASSAATATAAAAASAPSVSTATTAATAAAALASAILIESGVSSFASMMDSVDEFAAVAPTRGAAPPPSPAVSTASLAGIWEKDLESSDVAGYEKALDLWQISGVQKATARLIEGLELAASGSERKGSFNVHFLTIIPYFKVTESYPLGGGTAKMRRRDQRSGDAQAHAEVLPNGVVCRATWSAPFAGQLEETYTLPDPAGRPDVLHVTSTIRVGDQSATTLQVYNRRRNMSARELISASERRNGKAQDVLQRFGM